MLWNASYTKEYEIHHTHVNWKRLHNLKDESSVLFGGQNWGLQHLRSLWDAVPKRHQGELGYTGVFATKASSQNTQRLLWSKENRISQVKEFGALLRMGRCNSLGSLKSVLWCASYLSGAIPCVFSSWVSSGCTVGGVTTVSNDWMAGGIMFLSGVPSGLTIRAALT